MPIKIKCSACSNKLTVPDSYAGKRGKCPKCGEQIRIPAESEPDDKFGIQVGEPENQQKSISGIPNFADQDAVSGLSGPSISIPATAVPDLFAPPNSEAANPFAVTPGKKGKKVVSSVKPSRQHLQLTNYNLRQIGVLSTATTLAIIYAILGLIFGLFIAGLTIIASIVGSSSVPQGGGDLLAVGIGSALFVVIIYPVMLCIVGFIGGALMAFLYNLAAMLTGGIEFRFGD